MSDAELRAKERRAQAEPDDEAARARASMARLRSDPAGMFREALKVVLEAQRPSNERGLVSVQATADAIERAEEQRQKKERRPRPGVAYAHGAKRSTDPPEFMTYQSLDIPAWHPPEDRTPRGVQGSTVFWCEAKNATLSGHCFDAGPSHALHREIGKVELWREDGQVRVRLKPGRPTSQVVLATAYEGCMTVGVGLASAKGFMTPGAAWDILWPWLIDEYANEKVTYQLGVKAASWRKLIRWAHGDKLRLSYEPRASSFCSSHSDARLDGCEVLNLDRIHGPKEAALAWAASVQRGSLFQ